MERTHPLGRRALRALAALLVTTAFCVAVTRLVHDLGGYTWDRLTDDVSRLGPGPVLAAVAATAASYLLMTGYDALALRYAGHPLPYRRYAAASFVATAFGNSLGASALVGAALRARMYSTWQVPPAAIARVIGFNLVTLGLGAAVLGAAGALHTPTALADLLHVPPLAVRAGAVVSLVVVAGYLVWSRVGRPAPAVRGHRLEPPALPLGLAQVALSTLEWFVMAAALAALVPGGTGVPFPAFAAAFTLATTVGLISNVPGGLGVFEATLLACLDGRVGLESLATGLVLYRTVYFALPMLVAAAVLVALESDRRRPDRRRPDPLASRPSGAFTPTVLAVGSFAVGVSLLVTGDGPDAGRDVDLPTFTASMLGLGLVLLALGLRRRLRGAWLLAVGTVGVYLVVALAGHAPGHAAMSAAVLLGLLAPARGAFNASTCPLRGPEARRWLVLGLALAAVSLTWHTLRTTPLLTADRTWWSALADPDLPWWLRAGVAATVTAVWLGGLRLLAPRRPRDGMPDDDDLADAERLVAASARHGSANLLFTGDKRLLFGPDRTSVIMYQVTGRTWVAMGDPIGDPAGFAAAVQEFVDRSRAHAARPVFYAVGAEHAGLYRAAGLRLTKLGEEARVTLDAFTLAGRDRAGLRRIRNANTRAGCTVEILDPGSFEELLPALRDVSDAWLAERRTREKSFSLGAFDEAYVRRFPLAVARCEGEIVAFASLWTTGAGGEVQVDLMRRSGDAPPNVMGHLFVEIILWAQERGYAAFNLGMAPLSGLDDGPGRSVWNRLGHLVWTHGERLYNFRGLRHFKDRFDPAWNERYVAAPGGAELPTAMLDVATLVAGGLRGLLPHPGPAVPAPRRAADPAPAAVGSQAERPGPPP